MCCLPWLTAVCSPHRAVMLMLTLHCMRRSECGQEGGGAGLPTGSSDSLQSTSCQVREFPLLGRAVSCPEAPCSAVPDVVSLPVCSGDVGIGLNVRRMRTDFLSAFTVTYSLRPLGEFGTIFRRYPNQWQVLRPGSCLHMLRASDWLGTFSEDEQCHATGVH